jgi:tRNA pseudouridine38-40 synthase
MARYQIILAYDGTDFLGFQRQGSDRTVQLVVEAALQRIGWGGASILAAGRTDSGVHASGQVIAFDLDWKHGSQQLKKAINANLPPDVAVREVLVAADDFHPRFDAVGRSYCFRVYCAQERNPLRDRFAWRVWPEVDFALLQEAARVVVGTHDCAAFGTPPKPGGSTFRMIYSAEWRQEEDVYCFDVNANAFLYHMVRRMVYLMVAVGQRRLSLEAFSAGFRSGFINLAGLAGPQGLTLSEVQYLGARKIGSLTWID